MGSLRTLQTINALILANFMSRCSKYFWFGKTGIPPARPEQDYLCGLVVRVPGYTSRGPGSIPGATRLSEK
jgi:hypothetical protein